MKGARQSFYEKSNSIGLTLKSSWIISQVLTVAMSISLLLLGVDAASADYSETCDQCKMLRCLKETVVQKQKMITVYEGLRTFWTNKHLDENGRPIMVQNLSNLKEPERSKIYSSIVSNLNGYAIMEESRTGVVEKPEGCGYPEDNKGLGASTDSFLFCTTKGLENVKAVSCKELADLVDAHEGIHRNACKKRQIPHTDYWSYIVPGKEEQKYPPNILTPAGLASEEITAYQLEIDGLKRLIKKVEARCAVWSGTITYLRTTDWHPPIKWDPSGQRSEKHEDSSSYQVKITITGERGNKSRSSAQIQSTAIVTTAQHYAEETHIVDPQGCSISGPPVLKLDVTTSKDSSGTATQELPGSISVNEDGSYRIEFKEPREIVEHGFQIDVSTSTGWCDPEKQKRYNYNRKGPITNNRRIDGYIVISGRLDPNDPDTLSGTFLPPGKPLPASSTRPGARTEKTVITWDIQRHLSPGR